MGIIAWIIIGLLAAAVVSTLHRDTEPDGALGAAGVGVVGAVLGGVVAAAGGMGAVSSFFSLAGWLVAILSAVALLTMYHAVLRGRLMDPFSGEHDDDERAQMRHGGALTRPSSRD